MSMKTHLNTIFCWKGTFYVTRLRDHPSQLLSESSTSGQFLQHFVESVLLQLLRCFVRGVNLEMRIFRSRISSRRIFFARPGHFLYHSFFPNSLRFDACWHFEPPDRLYVFPNLKIFSVKFELNLKRFLHLPGLKCALISLMFLNILLTASLSDSITTVQWNFFSLTRT